MTEPLCPGCDATGDHAYEQGRGTCSTCNRWAKRVSTHNPPRCVVMSRVVTKWQDYHNKIFIASCTGQPDAELGNDFKTFMQAAHRCAAAVMSVNLDLGEYFMLRAELLK